MGPTRVCERGGAQKGGPPEKWFEKNSIINDPSYYQSNWWTGNVKYELASSKFNPKKQNFYVRGVYFGTGKGKGG